MTPDQHFRRRERLTRRSDFARVFAARQRQGDGRLVVYVADNRLEWSRLGLSVSKRVGGAVHRNYIRRRIREAFRKAKNALPTGLDIVCVALPGVADAEYDLPLALRRLVEKAARKNRHRGDRPRN